MTGARLRDAILNWGSTAAERSDAFPCDRYLAAPDTTLYRAVGARADSATMYAWLCQLRRAPYSYDWIDNLGRRSPSRRDPELERLQVGQSFMGVFRLVDFEPGRDVTLEHRGPLFGHVALTYRVVPLEAGCRVVVKVVARYPPAVRLPMRALLPLGDLIMMRRQLLNLATLASASSPPASAPA